MGDGEFLCILGLLVAFSSRKCVLLHVSTVHPDGYWSGATRTGGVCVCVRARILS